MSEVRAAYDFLRAHSKAAVAVTAAVIVPLRLLGVAGWNTDTALALLQESGTGTLIVGTVVGVLEFAVVIAPIVIALVLLAAPQSRRALTWTCVAGAVTLLLVAFAPERRTVFVADVVYVVVAFVLRHPLARAESADRKIMLRTGAWLLGAAATLTVGFLVLATVIGDQPWLPPETVRLADGTVRIGYVVSSGDDVVMLVGGKQIVHLPGPPKARVVCRRPGARTDRSAAATVFRPLRTTPYPVCDPSLV